LCGPGRGREPDDVLGDAPQGYQTGPRRPGGVVDDVGGVPDEHAGEPGTRAAEAMSTDRLREVGIAEAGGPHERGSVSEL